MKKVILPFLFILGLGFYASAQNSASIEPIMKKGLEFVKEIEKKYGDKAIIVKSEFDFAFDDNYTILDLSNTLTYVFGGLGDDNIADITMIIYKKENGQWVKVAEDAEMKNSAVISYTPPTSGEYAVDLHVNKYVNGETKIGHVALFVIATK
jgi:lipopolysaccharide export LptBFGC system permease protein LptF